MKRDRVAVVVAVLLLTAASSVPGFAQPQYYNYNTQGSANGYPFNSPPGRQVQLLFRPGDFSQPTAAPAGTITSVSFLVNSATALGPWTYTNLTIRMGQSSITSFTSGALYGGSLTTVYHRDSVLLSAASGDWLTLTLDTPLAYDPTQSLIVEVGHCGAPPEASGWSMCATSVTGVRRINSGPGCPPLYQSEDSTIFHFGITFLQAEPVPTTTEWGLILFAFTLAVASVHLLRRRAQAREMAS